MEIDMSYKIVVDSCCELPKELLQDVRFERVPLELSVGDYHIQDDENFEQKEFLEKVAAYPKCPKSSCPSPQKFMEAYCTEAEHVYCITLSSKLSGSYNSAVLGKTLYEEAKGAKQIHVIDSESASGGETQLALKLMELEEAGLSFEQIGGINMYQELKGNENFSDKYATWIIAYCLDTDSFFVTNQRHFFWEYHDEFQCENDAVNYFRNHLNEFRNVRKEILSHCGGWSIDKDLFLENTKERF